MSGPLNRIKAYIDFKGIKISTFEKSVGFSNGLFGGQLKKNKSIGVDKLENILKVYPDLNANWVLTGQESMLRSNMGHDKKALIEYVDMENEINHIIQRYHEDVIGSLNGVIAAQQKTVAILEQLVSKLENAK